MKKHMRARAASGAAALKSSSIPADDFEIETSPDGGVAGHQYLARRDVEARAVVGLVGRNDISAFHKARLSREGCALLNTQIIRIEDNGAGAAVANL